MFRHSDDTYFIRSAVGKESEQQSENVKNCTIISETRRGFIGRAYESSRLLALCLPILGWPRAHSCFVDFVVCFVLSLTFACHIDVPPPFVKSVRPPAATSSPK